MRQVKFSDAMEAIEETAESTINSNRQEEQSHQQAPASGSLAEDSQSESYDVSIDRFRT